MKEQGQTWITISWLFRILFWLLLEHFSFIRRSSGSITGSSYFSLMSSIRTKRRSTKSRKWVRWTRKSSLWRNVWHILGRACRRSRRSRMCSSGVNQSILRSHSSSCPYLSSIHALRSSVAFAISGLVCWRFASHSIIEIFSRFFWHCRYRIAFELFAFIGVTEIFFYYSHWMLVRRFDSISCRGIFPPLLVLFLQHFPSIYGYVHKKHHRFQAPIGLACEYAHPIEFVISNIGPVIAGPLLFRSHLLTTWLWLMVALIGTINHHSGYRLPGFLGSGLSNPAFHDFHHAQFNNNYGLLGILDRLHGTDGAWQAKKLREKQLSMKSND